MPSYAEYVGNENGRIEIQLLKWSYLFYGRIPEDKDWKSRKNNPTKWSLKNNKNSKNGSKKRKAVTLDGPEGEGLDEGQNRKKFRQYNGTCGHTTDQCTTLKALVKQTKEKRKIQFDKRKRFTKHEVKVML